MKDNLFVVEVVFQPSPKSRKYSYLYDPNELVLKRGEDILVPVGSEGKHARATVVRVKGLTCDLSPHIDYKTLEVNSVEMSKKLIKQADELVEYNKRKEKLVDQLRDTIVDF